MLFSLSGSLEEQPSETPPSTATSPSDDDRLSPASVLHDAAARLLDVQISTDDILNSRNANIFSVASTILPVTFGLLGLTEREIPDLAKMTLVTALIVYALVLASSFRASFIRGLAYRPDLRFLSEHTDEYPGRALQEWVALEYLTSTEVNQPFLQRKARWVGAANALLYIEALLLSLAALLTLL